MTDPYQVIEGVDIGTLSLRPHHVLVRWLKKEETKGGILLPQNRQRKSYMVGIVLKAGPESANKVIPGAKIQFNSLCDKEFMGAQDPADRDSVFVMVDDEIHGIIVGADEFIPVLDLVLIKPDLVQREVSGIIVTAEPGKPMAAKEGVIVLVGDGVKDEEELSTGLRVAYDPTVAEQLVMNGVDLVLVRSSYILGVLEAV